MILTRSAMIASAACFTATAPTTGLTQSSPAIHVLKDPNCGCCTASIKILEEDGFKVTTKRSFGTLPIRHKLENGIPQSMTSCHTDEVEGYMIDGHLPTTDIRKLFSERPDAVGLAVPGMP